MEVSRRDAEEEMRKWINHIAVIVLCDEFQALKKELESVYLRSNLDNVKILAFQDALYAFLAEEDSEPAPDPVRVMGNGYESNHN